MMVGGGLIQPSFVANGKLVCIPTNNIDFCVALSIDFDLFVDLIYVF